jgi:CheY-like chemotaxis protein
MNGKKVLIVEDNLMNTELASDLLEAAGFVVYQARTAEDGMQLAFNHQPDVLLMDISLPGMDGLRAARILKSDPRTRIIPIIALTAHAMKGDEENALQSGCDGYLSKPINTRTFAAIVTSFLKPGEEGGRHAA